MKPGRVLIGVAALAAGAAIAAGVVYSGAYNVAADDPHWDLTYRVLETARDRSIAARAPQGEMPDLTSPALIAEGAHHYDEMCVQCHLRPGRGTTDLRAGLYPQPPDFTKHARRLPPREAFWVIKHGLKMTGMPAWGVTEDDEDIWGLVAFMQRLPDLDETQYRALERARGRERHDDDGEGEDRGEDTDDGGRRRRGRDD